MSQRAGSMRLGLTALSVVVILSCASVIVAPHAISHFPLPKSEDFEFTTVPGIILAQQSLSGSFPAWSWHIGLGSPWPIPLGLGHSPLFPLLAFMPPLSATACIVWLHLVLMGVAVGRLSSNCGIKPGLQPICILSAMLSPALEYLFASDAPTVFISFTWLPVILLLIYELAAAQGIRRRAVITVTLGLCIGLCLREGHVGVLAIYLLGLGLVVVGGLPRMLPVLPALALAGVMGAAMAAEQLFVLATEAARFGTGVPRYQQGLWWGGGGIIWGLLGRPFFLPTMENMGSAGELLQAWTRQNTLVRTVGFGSCLFVALLLGSVGLWRDDRSRPLVISFMGCIVLMFIPIQSLPVAVSATWPLRDVANLFGILLGALALTRLIGHRPRLVRAIGGGQCLLVLVAAIPLLAGAIWSSDRGIFSTAQYNSLVDRDKPSPYIVALREAIGPGQELSARFVLSSRAFHLMGIEALVDQGAVNNVAVAHGLSEVSFIAKGISFDSIQTSQAVPYGTITGDAVKAFTATSSDTDWPLDNQPLLTLLGIRAVVAGADERVLAPALRKVAQLHGRDGFSVAIYRNEEILAPAFVLPESILREPLGRRTGCNRDVLICRDVAPVVRQADSRGIRVVAGIDTLTIALPSSEEVRPLVATVMFRPEWRASDGEGRPVAVRDWHGLVQVDVPGGVTAVRLEYIPLARIAARRLTIAAAFLLTLAAMTIGVAGRRS